MENIKLNVSLLKRRVPNLTTAARSVGLQPATVSKLTTGKVPVGRAEVKTIVALATLADCSLDELIIRGEDVEKIETGIKVLDLFAPLVHGGTVGLVARPGMGQLAILAEIFHRLQLKDYETGALFPDDEEIDETIKATSRFICHTVEDAITQIKRLGKKKDVIIAVDRIFVMSGEVYLLQSHLEEAGIKSLTTVLIDPRGEASDEEEPFGPLETLWQFDAELIARKIYPAINPVLSTSTVLEASHLESNHMMVQQRARKLMRRYRELRFLVTAYGIDKMPQADLKMFERGKRLEAYLTQPLFTAEPYTKLKGVSVEVKEMLTDVQKILTGGLDDTSSEELFNRGVIQK